jgi:hypothetical protein
MRCWDAGRSDEWLHRTRVDVVYSGLRSESVECGPCANGPTTGSWSWGHTSGRCSVTTGFVVRVIRLVALWWVEICGWRLSGHVGALGGADLTCSLLYGSCRCRDAELAGGEIGCLVLRSQSPSLKCLSESCLLQATSPSSDSAKRSDLHHSTAASSRYAATRHFHVIDIRRHRHTTLCARNEGGKWPVGTVKRGPFTNFAPRRRAEPIDHLAAATHQSHVTVNMISHSMWTNRALPIHPVEILAARRASLMDTRRLSSSVSATEVERAVAEASAPRSRVAGVSIDLE